MNILLKVKYSFYSALVFFLCANPETFKILYKLLGGVVGSSTGCPSPVGLFLATILFFGVMLALMMFPRD